MSAYVNSSEQLVVEVYVRNVRRSTDFYRQLGFDVLREESDFTELSWEGHRFFLEERSELPEPAVLPQANVRVMVRDVDGYWQRVREMGVRVVFPIRDQAYGLRDFTIADPDGFGLRFATRIPDLQAPEKCQSTY